MAQVLGNRRIAIARELTKIHEEIFRGTVEEAMEHFRQPRGEFTLVIEGRKEEAEESLLTPKIEKELRSLIDEGIAAKEIVARLSPTTGLSRKELYRACLKLKSNRGL
jgi:16S rRNA (cytidine1402-2'-O)-methyltransferase